MNNSKLLNWGLAGGLILAGCQTESEIVNNEKFSVDGKETHTSDKDAGGLIIERDAGVDAKPDVTIPSKCDVSISIPEIPEGGPVLIGTSNVKIACFDVLADKNCKPGTALRSFSLKLNKPGNYEEINDLELLADGVMAIPEMVPNFSPIDGTVDFHELNVELIADQVKTLCLQVDLGSNSFFCGDTLSVGLVDAQELSVSSDCSQDIVIHAEGFPKQGPEHTIVCPQD